MLKKKHIIKPLCSFKEYYVTINNCSKKHTEYIDIALPSSAKLSSAMIEIGL